MLRVLLGIGVGVGLGLAQVEKPAAALLEQAKKAHGGAALVGLRSYQETAEVRLYLGGEAQPPLRVVSTVDFAKGWIRLETWDGKYRIQVEQIGPSGAKSWSEANGLGGLEAGRAAEVRGGLLQTWYGLRFGGQGRQVAKLLGPTTLGDVRGRGVEVRTQGVSTVYVFGAGGRLQAERYDNSQGVLTVVYADYRGVAGVQIPFTYRMYSKGLLFAEARVVSASVNPQLPKNAFALP